MIQLIKHWRGVFGLPNRTVLQIPVKEELDLAINLIEEEYYELKEAVSDNSLNDIADAIGDLYFVVTQMAMVCGLNPEELVQKVYDSNMSKLCKTEDEAIQTVSHYLQKGIKTYIEQKDEYFIIKRSEDGKVLKSINFKEPDWSYLTK